MGLLSILLPFYQLHHFAPRDLQTAFYSQKGGEDSPACRKRLHSPWQFAYNPLFRLQWSCMMLSSVFSHVMSPRSGANLGWCPVVDSESVSGDMSALSDGLPLGTPPPPHHDIGGSEKRLQNVFKEFLKKRNWGINCSIWVKKHS